MLLLITRGLLQLGEHDCDRGAAEPLLLPLKLQLPVESQPLRLPQLPV